ncbi:hypothetical protein ACFVU2_20975 [Leifsonia sp. NPDC058194]|uniref:hypothetical protein n=1 Tax=Leifsonia sp. NPDC058194 TaxID=3346374 RepID=UPI0036DE8002
MNNLARPATSAELVRRNIHDAFQLEGVDIGRLASVGGEITFSELVAVALLLGCRPAQFFNSDASGTPSGTPGDSDPR